MNVSGTVKARVVEKRRWRIPPPLIQDGTAPGPEGLTILGEIRSQLGAVLWKSLRTTVLWAEADPASRRNLFDGDAADRRQAEILAAASDAEKEPRVALEDLLSILDRPDRVDADFAASACSRIAAWAESEQARGTHLEFLQAAALCCPEDAWCALAVGSASRDLAQYSRAEAWYFRAVGLGRQSADWAAYVKAYLNHGIMMFRRGALPAARRSYLKALRRSRRQGLREGEAKSLHDLSILEYRAGSLAKALAFAGDALQAYGPAHENLPRLAHDVAYYWMERGDYEHSLPVFFATLSRVKSADRATVLGSLSRAAAGAGDLRAFEWAKRELQGCDVGPGVAEAWVDLARAALTLTRHEEAWESAQVAESIARMRREGQMRFLAESIMNEIQAEGTARESEESVEVAPDPAVSDELARRLIRTLQLAPAVASA